MIRLTSETALREIPQIYIIPNMLTTIIPTTNVIIKAMPMLKPSNINVTANIAPETRKALVSKS